MDSDGVVLAMIHVAECRLVLHHGPRYLISFPFLGRSRTGASKLIPTTPVGKFTHLKSSQRSDDAGQHATVGLVGLSRAESKKCCACLVPPGSLIQSTLLPPSPLANYSMRHPHLIIPSSHHPIGIILIDPAFSFQHRPTWLYTWHMTMTWQQPAQAHRGDA